MVQTKKGEIIANMIIEASRELIKKDPTINVILPTIKLVQNPDYEKSARFEINLTKIEE